MSACVEGSPAIPPRTGGASLRHEALLIAALAAFAGAIRCLTWSRTAALFNDGPVFIGLARLMRDGQWARALEHPYHPLYPLATRVAQLGIGDWERAAVAVSITSGAAAVAILFVFLRDAFGRRAAWIGALTLAVHPYAVFFTSDVQSEGLYLALFLGAAAVLWRALDTARPALAAGAGALSGLAYLTRPEGLGVALLGLAFAGHQVLRGRWALRSGLAWSAALGAGALLLSAPYVGALRAQSGSWMLTQKKSVAHLSGLPSAPASPSLDQSLEGPGIGGSPPAPPTPEAEAASEPPAPDVAAPPAPGPWGRHAAALAELGETLVSTLRPELVALLLLGIFARRRVPAPPAAGEFVFGFAAFYLVVLYALALGAGYVSRRHVLPPAALTLGFVAAGVPVAGRLIASGFRRLAGASGPPSAWLATAVGVTLIVGFAAPKTLRARRPERLAERRAAEWLREQPERSGAVAASKRRVAYYAGAAYVPFPDSNPNPDAGPVLAYLRASRARYVIVDDQRLDADPALRQAASQGMRLLHSARGGGRRAAVFALATRSGAAEPALGPRGD